MTVDAFGPPLKALIARSIAFWGRIKTAVLMMLVGILLLATIAAFSFCGIEMRRNRTITDLMHNHDISVSQDAAPKVLFARAYFLVAHNEIDQAQPLVSLFDLRGSAKERADLHYDLGNSRLRAAFDKIDSGNFDAAGAFVGLAQEDYIEAMHFDPDNWNARFNFDVAARLVRQYPSFLNYQDPRRQGPHPIWTELPNVPRGEP